MSGSDLLCSMVGFYSQMSVLVSKWNLFLHLERDIVGVVCLSQSLNSRYLPSAFNVSMRRRNVFGQRCIAPRTTFSFCTF